MRKSDLSRRGFLLTGAAAAAAAAGAQFVFAADAPASKPAATQSGNGRKTKKPPKPLVTTRTKYSGIRLACIGIGGRGRADLTAVVDAGADIVALCDIDTDTLDKTQAELSGSRTYTDYRELFDKEANNIDAVVVATPDHNHACATMHAIKLRKHVYCEKPLTYDIHEARVVTEAARKYNVKTQMGNQGAASDVMRRQVEYVRSGIVGNIREVHVYTNRPIWPQGLVPPTKDMERPVPSNIKWDNWLGPAPYRPYATHLIDGKDKCVYMPFDWRGWWDFGTGALGDMACHLTNNAFWALDLRNPAVTEAFQNGRTVDSPPNWSIIKWEFPEFHGRPAVKMFWYDGGMLPPHTLVGEKGFPGEGFNGAVYVGEKGNIACGYMQEPYLVDEQMQKDLKPPEKTLPRSIGHHEEWLESILGGPQGASNFDHSGPLTEMVLVGNLAVRSGQRIEWNVDKMKVTNGGDAQKYVKRDYRQGWSL